VVLLFLFAFLSLQCTLKPNLDPKKLIPEGVTALYSYTYNYPNIKIYQSVYPLNGHLYCVEEIEIMDSYRLNGGIKKAVGFIFATNAYQFQKQIGNYYFFTVTQSNKEPLRVVVYNRNSKKIYLFYGFTQQEFKNVEDAVMSADENKLVFSYYNSKMSYNPQRGIVTEWSPKLFIVDNLIGKVR
jgi:hypothetical protein